MKRVLSALVVVLALAGCGPDGYSSCEEAKKAGAAPVHRGEPGYSGKLDRDGDGVACES